MIALTRDHYVFVSRVTTDLSTVFFSVRYIAQARQVRAFPGFLVRHFGSVLSGVFIRSSLFPVTAFGSPNFNSPLARGFATVSAQ